MERAVGFEPTQCQVGSLVPFRLATPAQNGPGSGGRTHDLAIIDRVLCQLSYPWIRPFELVPGAGVEPA
jgi:hypothetical protein